MTFSVYALLMKPDDKPDRYVRNPLKGGEASVGPDLGGARGTERKRPAHARVVPQLDAQPDALRRHILLAGTGLALAGCTNMGSVGLMSDTLSLVGKDMGQGYPRTRDEVIALPYAQLGLARDEKGPRGILVLADALGDELVWISGNRVNIVTLQGRVVRTTGLRSDFAGTSFRGEDLWNLTDPARAALSATALERIVRIEPGQAPPVRMTSLFAADGEERIEILGDAIDTIRYREEIDVPEWRWKAVNRWWLDPQTRMAWRSVQHLTPDQPPLVLEVLKRPA